MDCSLPGFSVHGIFQARILEWIAISFSRRSSQPKDWIQVSHIVGRCFTIWASREVLEGPPKGRRTNLVSWLGNLGLFPAKRPDLDSVDDSGKQGWVWRKWEQWVQGSASGAQAGWLGEEEGTPLPTAPQTAEPSAPVAPSFNPYLGKLVDDCGLIIFPWVLFFERNHEEVFKEVLASSKVG